MNHITTADKWPTVWAIARKQENGETLTAWEMSVYRLNYRTDGTRYSCDPKIREAQYAEDINAPKGTV